MNASIPRFDASIRPPNAWNLQLRCVTTRPSIVCQDDLHRSDETAANLTSAPARRAGACRGEAAEHCESAQQHTESERSAATSCTLRLRLVIRTTNLPDTSLKVKTGLLQHATQDALNPVHPHTFAHSKTLQPTNALSYITSCASSNVSHARSCAPSALGPRERAEERDGARDAQRQRHHHRQRRCRHRRLRSKRKRREALDAVQGTGLIIFAQPLLNSRNERDGICSGRIDAGHDEL
eukprot:2361821-Pleurochrysis_carterae.AAC.1